MNRSNWASPLLSILMASTAWAESPEPQWELIEEENGITSHRREIPGSDLLALRGEGILNVPLGKLLHVLSDNSRRTEWVDRLMESRSLDDYAKHEAVIYQAYELPAFISNRDFVFHAKALREDDGTVTIEMSSVAHPKAPETIGVRAHLGYSSYRLVPKGPDKTHVTVEAHTDPRGALPAWIVNMIQKSWPVKTLGGLEKQAQKDYVIEYPMPPWRNPQAPALVKTTEPKDAATPALDGTAKPAAQNVDAQPNAPVQKIEAAKTK